MAEVCESMFRWCTERQVCSHRQHQPWCGI